MALAATILGEQAEARPRQEWETTVQMVVVVQEGWTPTRAGMAAMELNGAPHMVLAVVVVAAAQRALIAMERQVMRAVMAVAVHAAARMVHLLSQAQVADKVLLW